MCAAAARMTEFGVTCGAGCIGCVGDASEIIGLTGPVVRGVGNAFDVSDGPPQQAARW